MRRAWCCIAAISLASPLPAATVLERHVRVLLRGDGTVRESLHLAVRIDDRADASSWSTYRVPLNENRTLERLEARTTFSGGRVSVLGADDQETVDGTSSGLFHGSLRLHLAHFRDLAPGAVLAIDQEVAVRPYYPTGRVALGGGAIADLRVEVEAEGGSPPRGFRWYVEGPAGGLTIEETAVGVAVRGHDLAPIDVPELAPVTVVPVLRYGWGRAGTWDDVGRWYHELAASVPRSPETVRAEAGRLAAGLDEPRRRLDALVGFVQDKVRNVAVLIGEGNYRPSPPGQVLERKWGDCKDKAVLLVDLLRAAGVEAYPALLNKNAKRRIDPRFPSPDQFNHAIVAVPSAVVAVDDDDPVAGGYLFVDPIQTRGAGRWLDPDDQDQDALVVRPEAAQLVRTPLRPDLERRRLTADLAVDEAGDARGRAKLEIRGEIAYDLLQGIGDLPPKRLAEEARAIFARLLPGAGLADVTWSIADGGIPSIVLEAAVTLPGLVQVGRGGRSFLLPGMRATPDPQLLRERRVPVVLPARSARTTWNLTLPPGWCPPSPRDDEVANDVGVFAQTISFDGSQVLTVDRRVELHERWIESGELAELSELSLAEHRTHRRRTRWTCEAADSADLDGVSSRHGTSAPGHRDARSPASADLQ